MNQKEYTVFAVYEDSYQPYSATVMAGSPEIAVRLAQLQCLEDNSAEVIEPGDYGSCTLVGFQVVEGNMETVPFDEMPLDVGDDVFWDKSMSAPWHIEQILTDGPELRAGIMYGPRVEYVPTSELTPYPNVNV